MATFAITAPDGQQFEVTAPDGASQEEILQYAQSQFNGGSTKPAPTESLALSLSPRQRIGPQKTIERGGEAPQLAGAASGGVLSAIGSGAKYGLDTTVLGIQQLAQRGNALEQQRLAEAAEAARAEFAPIQEQRPFATALGQAVPYLVTGMASLPKAVGLSVVGEGAKYGTAAERSSRAAIGATSTLLGGAAGNVLGKLIRPASQVGPRTPVADIVSPHIGSPSHRRALVYAKALGVQPLAHTVTGGKLLEQATGLAVHHPATADIMARHAVRNAFAYNRAAAKSIGEDAAELGAETLSRAHTRIGSVFAAVQQLPGKPIRIGDRVRQAADDVLATQNKLVKESRDPELISIAKQMRTLSQFRGRISGETYNLNRSDLTGRANAAFLAPNTAPAGRAYQKLLAAIDDSADASLRALDEGTLANALKTARDEHANLMILETGTVAAGGNINLPALTSAVRANNPMVFRTGKAARNPLHKLAVISETLERPLPSVPGNIPSRLTGSSMTAALIGGIPAYAAARVATSPAVQWYPRALLTHPALSQLMGPVAQTARLGGRVGALGGLSTQFPALYAPN